MYKFNVRGFLAGALVAAASVLPVTVGAVEQPEEAKYYFSPSLGVLKFEGNEPVQDGFLGTVRLGYDYSEWFSFEAVLGIAPRLKEQFQGVTTVTDASTGASTYEKRSILYDRAGVHDTWSAQLGFDTLFHFTRWERLDPYLAVGVGGNWYRDDLGNGNFNPALRYGGGVMYHFNDEWAIRADFRGFFVDRNSVEANAQIDAGVVWNWAARVGPAIVAVKGPNDSDGDGLNDEEEKQHGTEVWDPDTDKDGLKDGEEVKVYFTDPRNPDTDFDGLKDGEEVKTYTTDPLKWDTDNGGVSDGHEVLEDGTNPKEAKDDLRLFELHIEFDYDKAQILPQFHRELDIVAKIMLRHPGSTARIEGHCDQTKKSEKKHNDILSQKRAEAVLEYFAGKGIPKKDLTAKGYGFSRPKVKPDLKNGTPENRRVEIYLRGVMGEDAKNPAPSVSVPVAVPAEKIPAEKVEKVVVPAAPVVKEAAAPAAVKAPVAEKAAVPAVAPVAKEAAPVAVKPVDK